jgi:hypothetical protein
VCSQEGWLAVTVAVPVAVAVPVVTLLMDGRPITRAATQTEIFDGRCALDYYRQ